MIDDFFDDFYMTDEMEKQLNYCIKLHKELYENENKKGCDKMNLGNKDPYAGQKYAEWKKFMERDEEKKDKEMNDKFKPDYYKLPGNEISDVMDLISHLNLDFMVGSALEYIIRAGKKPDVQESDDLTKAVECLQRRIVMLKTNFTS